MYLFVYCLIGLKMVTCIIRILYWLFTLYVMLFNKSAMSSADHKAASCNHVVFILCSSVMWLIKPFCFLLTFNVCFSWRAGELKPIPGLVSTQSQGTNNHLESTMAQTCMFWEMGMWKQDWNAGPTHSGPLSHQCCILCFLSIKHATSGGWVLKEMLQPKVGRRVSWTGWIWTTAVLFRGGKNNALLMPVSGLVVDHRHS